MAESRVAQGRDDMNPERFQHIKSVLLQASELPPAARTAFLRKVCHDDAEFESIVGDMLAEDANPLKLTGSSAVRPQQFLSSTGRGGGVSRSMRPQTPLMLRCYGPNFQSVIHTRPHSASSLTSQSNMPVYEPLSPYSVS